MDKRLAEDLATFLAHSLAVEKQSAKCLRETADQMSLHSCPALAALLNELAELSELHASEVAAICCAHHLPALEASVSINIDFARAMAELSAKCSPKHALELMLNQEISAANFYSDVANSTRNPEIKEYASAFAEEEVEHSDKLRQRLRRLS